MCTLTMERWTGRVALVTGASSGIGAAAAMELVRQGMTVVACARSLPRLQDIGGATVEPSRFHAYQCDVRIEADIERMFQWIREKLGGTDVLINNAGLSHKSPILEGSMADWRNILEVNVLALAKCSQEAYKCMKSRGVDDGYIINVNSLLGHTITSDFPYLNMYGASKHAVSAITKAIRLELRAAKSHIRVTSVSPGAVDTNFATQMFGAEVKLDELVTCKVLDSEDIVQTFLHVLSLPPHAQVDELTVRPLESVSP